MLFSATVQMTPEDLEQLNPYYSIHVRHRGRWISVRTVRERPSAEMLASTIYRRSGLPIEVRDSDGAVVTTFETSAIQ